MTTYYVKASTTRRPIYDKLVYEPHENKGKFLLAFITAASDETLFEILRECQKKPEGRDVYIDFCKKTDNLPEVIDEKEFVNIDPEKAVKAISRISGNTCSELIGHNRSRDYVIIEIAL